jgi:protease I
MKRLTISAIILTGFVVDCLGAYEPRIILLPEPKLTGKTSIEQALAKRRSVRQFTTQSLSLAQIAQLAWAGQGITEKQKGFRTAPSAGAVYPITLYFATEDGLFAYNPQKHYLEEALVIDVRNSLSEAALGQKAVAGAACDIIIAGSAEKLAAKYGERAEKFMLLEAGHIAQNIQLQAVSIGLGSVTVGAFETKNVAGVCKLPASLEPLYILCVGYPPEEAPAKKVREKKEAAQTIKEEKKEAVQMKQAEPKKAVLIIASENFRDEELFETKLALEKAGVETTVASTKTGAIKGMLGGKAKAEMLVKDIAVGDYDAVVFVGGSGAREYFDNQTALDIARRAKDKQKVIAAICIAPTIFANAHILKNVKVTSFISERAKLQGAGAEYTGVPVEQDGLIITANGPEAAAKFGKAIVDTLIPK